MTDALDIFLNETHVGVLTNLVSGQTLFSFNEAYAENPNHPILSQSYYSADRALITKARAYSVKLPPFFSNLLPEGPLRDYIAERGDIKPTNEFDLLRLLGEDLPGAVRARPANAPPLQTNVDDHLNGNGKASDENPLRFSLAGVQLKFSALMERQGGLTIPASGVGGDWIVKLPSPTHDNVPENEYAIMHLAGEIGIPVPEIKLVSLNDVEGLPDFGKLRGSQALAVKRFDRGESGRRIHIEDFAQVYNIFPDNKYEGVSFNNIAGMIWTILGEDGLRDYIARLVFTVLTGNGDMHLKNWSFIYRDGRTPELSPAYDLLSTIPYIPNDTLALKLVKTKNMMACDVEVFEKLAEKAELPKKLVTDTVRKTVAKTREGWEKNKNHYDMPEDIRDIINEHMGDVPLSE